MKSVRFESIGESAITKIHNSVFKNGIENPIVENIESSNNDYLLMIPESRVDSRINNMVMIEAKRLVMNEKINTLRWKRQQELLNMELKKFQNKLLVSRPKFDGSQFNNNEPVCPFIGDGQLAVVHKKLDLSKAKLNECDHLNSVEVICRRGDEMWKDDCPPQSVELNNSAPNSGNITVVIKDKPVVPSAEENLEIMRWVFNALRAHVSEAKRLREVKAKIQQNIMTGKLRRFFNAWRNKVKQSKEFAARKREQCEMKDVKKIELFVNLVKEKQKILGKNDTKNKVMKKNKLNTNNGTSGVVEKIKNTRKDFINHAEPLNNRLKVQKKIIAEQKMKLAEQNRLIEEMKLKQIEVESKISGIETMNIAKTVLNNCGSRTRRILLAQLIQVNDDEKGKIVKSSATFPERLEARAAARKQKIRQRQIEYEKRLHEEKLKEEAIRIDEERIRKQLQRDAEREAKIIREEQERKKAENIQRMKILNELADNFYRRYLLRNYIIKPLISLVKFGHNKMLIAAKHCDVRLLRRTFATWKNEAKQQLKIKLELSICMYNRNILWNYFRQWRETTKDEIRKYQVACDVYDLRLQERYFKIWMRVMIENQIRNIENEKKAANFYKNMIKKNYFIRWKNYLTISDGVKESDKRRDQWRQLVQTVVPDFAPKYRGVLIDD